MKGKNIVNPAQPLYFKHYQLLLVLFITMWLSSDIAAVKLVNIFGVTFTGGFIIFPFTTMLGNIISETYGYKNARQSIRLGALVNLLFIGSLYLVSILPASPHWHLDNEYKSVLLPGARIILASIFSFFIAEIANSYLIAKIKILDNGKSLFKRIFVSCSISSLLDISLFLIIAFYGVLSTPVLITFVGYAYLKKIACQILLYPLSSIVIGWLKTKEGYDIFDLETDFNPFSADNIYDVKSISSPHQTLKQKSLPK